MCHYLCATQIAWVVATPLLSQCLERECILVWPAAGVSSDVLHPTEAQTHICADKNPTHKAAFLYPGVSPVSGGTLVLPRGVQESHTGNRRKRQRRSYR